jgi:hypothetical protein
VNYLDWNDFKTESELKDEIRWFLYEYDQKHQIWIFNPKFEDKASEKIINSDIKTENQDVDVTISKRPVEKNHELSDSLKLRLDIEGNKRKLEAYALLLDYADTSFVNEILNYEEKWEYFMKDENFVKVDSKLQINSVIEGELLCLQRNNKNEWRYLFRSMRRKHLI